MNNSFPVSRFVLCLLLVALVATGPAFAKDQFPQTSDDGLQLRESKKVDAVYWKEGATLSSYKRVAILDCAVAFRKNWQRDQNQERRGYTVKAEDMERIKKTLGEEFRTVFTKELQDKGGYEIAEGANTDVLLLRPAIVDLDVTAPDLMAPGRTQTFAASAGAMTLYLEIYDSATSAIIGRVIDRSSARDSGRIMMSSRVTNRAEADRMLRRWADLLRNALDEAHGK